MEYKKQFVVYSMVYILVTDGLYNKLVEVTYATIFGPIYKVFDGLFDGTYVIETN